MHSFAFPYAWLGQLVFFSNERDANLNENAQSPALAGAVNQLNTMITLIVEKYQHHKKVNFKVLESQDWVSNATLK